MSVPLEATIRLVHKVGERKEMCIPITLISKTCLKTIETTAVIDSGASRTFISESFVKEHGIMTHRLKEPFQVNNADGTNSGKGSIMHYCILTVKIDQRTMHGKFNIHKLGHRDLILLGIPWLKAMNPIIDWAEESLSLPWTEKSDLLEEDINKEQRKGGLPALFQKKKGKRKWKNSKLKQSQEMLGMSKQKTNESVDSASVHPQDNPEHAIKNSLTPEKVSTTTNLSKQRLRKLLMMKHPVYYLSPMMTTKPLMRNMMYGSINSMNTSPLQSLVSQNMLFLMKNSLWNTLLILMNSELLKTSLWTLPYKKWNIIL
jgi:hypothetical protein